MVLLESGLGFGCSLLGLGRELVVADCDGTLGAFVYVELENVWAGIVADYVEVVFAADDLSQIDVRHEDGFAFGIGSGKKIPEGIHDATAAAADDRVRIIA